jgi:lysophospholipase L1-like esterase
MQLHYPGVFVACQSMVNLLVNNESRVTDPVYSWYTKDSIDMIEEMRKILPADKFSDLMDQIDLGVNRQNMLSMYPEYFFPDGVHPNREGHNKLWQYLKEQDIV